MQGGDTPNARRLDLLRATAALTALYLAGRAILPAAGHAAVDTWRLVVGLPIFAASVALLLQRARATPAARSGWLLLAAGVAIYPIGTVLTAAIGSSQSAPPSAHAAWLGFYVCAYLGLARLAHASVRPFPSAFLLDGVAAVLTLGAVVSAAASVAGAESYRLWEAALGVSYPALDLVLLGYTAWIVAVCPRPAAPMWRRLLAAWALLLACDIVFLALGAAQELSDIAIYTAGYPLVMVLLAWAAHAPPPPRTPLALDTRTAIAVPAALMVAVLGVLIAVSAQPIDGPTVPLVVAALAVLSARAVLIHHVAGRLAETRRFERGFDEAGVGMGIADLAGHWVRANGALAELLGHTPSSLVGRTVLGQVEGDHQAAARALRAQLLRGAGRVDPVHLRVVVPGDTRDILVTGDLIRAEPSAAPQFFVQVQDVTLERRARLHADLVSSISRQALALDDLGELVERLIPQLMAATGADLVAWIPLDDAEEPVTSPDVRLLEPGVLDDLRAGGSILLGTRDDRSVEVADPRAIELGLPSLNRRGLRHVAFTRVQPRAAGRAVLCVGHTRVPERASDERTCLGTIANVLATAADRAHDERASRHRALHDPLTGLANRALLSAHLSHAIASARRDGGNVGVLLIDLDRFKLVNDTLGHEIGDALLRSVADRLGRHTREGDLLARLGGDEFVLVLSRVADTQEVERAAARIVAALDEAFDIGGRELSVGASTGVAVVPATVATPDALLREADVAMYRAKRAGGARWSRADAATRARVERRDDLERDLRHAVSGDCLRLALQPQIAVDTRTLVGFEALVRWARPGHGLLYPDAFVPIAATVGLLAPIGDWVLSQGLEFLRRLPSQPGAAPRLALNLLPAQLSPLLPETIDRATAAAGLAADRLQIEVPATLLVTDEAAMEVIERLRERGVSIALEDFGTGWTSLSGLLRHPVDALKLDRSLVARLPESPTTQTIARAAVRLADEIGAVVTASGVESPEQLSVARDLGVRVAQGHLISPPVAADDAVGYARARAWESLLPS